jgi:hypothetical protein
LRAVGRNRETEEGEMKRRFLSWLVGIGALALAAAGTADAAPPQTCSGTLDAPGVLAGTYSSNVFVSGGCSGGGPAVIKHNLILEPGSVLVDFTGLTVNGNVVVKRGATLFVGQEEDAETAPAAPGVFRFAGNLTAAQPLGVVLHGVSIDGNVTESGGGGGFTCDPSGIFALFDTPVFSVLEGSHVGGGVTVSGLTSCWLGITHSTIDGGVRVLNNQLADPDAIEILDNRIGGNLVCHQNSMTWDSADITEELYPRQWEPNTVGGMRVGQCVTAPPLTQGGTSPGPF